MGTLNDSTHAALVADIGLAFKAMGLTQREGAYRLYDVLHPESDDEDEAKRFAEAFKKQMARPSTSIDTLQKYLIALQELPEFRKAGMHYLRPIPNEHISEELTRELEKVSREIHALVKSRRK